MSIQRHFDRILVVQRLETVSGNRKSFVSTGTIDAHLQLLTGEYSSKMPQVYGATHKGWCALEDDVQEGDLVRDEDGLQYAVVAVNRQNHGSQQFLELILKRYIS
jgi:hypothetical protein